MFVKGEFGDSEKRQKISAFMCFDGDVIFQLPYDPKAAYGRKMCRTSYVCES
jgi:hypothetical protein